MVGLRQGFRFRIVVSRLLVIFVLLYAVDHGQDLLLTINYSRIGAGLFVTEISIWALLNWYLPKIYDDVKPATRVKISNIAKDSWNYQTGPKPKKDFVRILATGLKQARIHLKHHPDEIPENANRED